MVVLAIIIIINRCIQLMTLWNLVSSQGIPAYKGVSSQLKRDTYGRRHSDSYQIPNESLLPDVSLLSWEETPFYELVSLMHWEETKFLASTEPQMYIFYCIKKDWHVCRVNVCLHSIQISKEYILVVQKRHQKRRVCVFELGLSPLTLLLILVFSFIQQLK